MTLSLLPHFIQFFSDGEIPGTPGTLATTFLAFGMVTSPFFPFPEFYILCCDICNVCSPEFGICAECDGIPDSAHIIGVCQHNNY